MVWNFVNKLQKSIHHKYTFSAGTTSSCDLSHLDQGEKLIYTGAREKQANKQKLLSCTCYLKSSHRSFINSTLAGRASTSNPGGLWSTLIQASWHGWLRRQYGKMLVRSHKSEKNGQECEGWSSHGCNDHEMMEFRMVWGRNGTNSRTTALDLRIADSGLFRHLLSAGQLVGFQGSPPPSSRMTCPDEQNIKQEWQ